jgi:hypothetical protein
VVHVILPEGDDHGIGYRKDLPLESQYFDDTLYGDANIMGMTAILLGGFYQCRNKPDRIIKMVSGIEGIHFITGIRVSHIHHLSVV